MCILGINSDRNVIFIRENYFAVVIVSGGKY